MSPVLAPRGAVCAALALVAATAHAQPVVARRPVAVVNLDLGNKPELIELAKQLSGALDAHPTLRPYNVTLATWDLITDPDRAALELAARQLQRATELVGNGDYTAAIDAARAGQVAVGSVTPTLGARLYADLAFVRGKALLGTSKLAEAQLVFAHAQRLDPTRTVDVGREPPDVVDAYAKSKPVERPTGRIDVRGDGITWIDGVDRGRAPNQFVVPVGLHLVAVTDATRETRAIEVEVLADAISLADVPQVSASLALQVERARKELAVAPDATKKLIAMKRLAAIIDVKDALLLSQQNGKLVYQAWRSDDADRAPGFSAPHTRANELPATMLEQLAPPAEPEEPPIKFDLPLEVTHWYERPTYWAGIAFGSALVGAGIYFLATSLRPDWFTPNGNVNLDDGVMVRR